MSRGRRRNRPSWGTYELVAKRCPAEGQMEKATKRKPGLRGGYGGSAAGREGSRGGEEICEERLGKWTVDFKHLF